MSNTNCKSELAKVELEIEEMAAKGNTTTAVFVDGKFHAKIKKALIAKGYDVWCILGDESCPEDYIGIDWAK